MVKADSAQTCIEPAQYDGEGSLLVLALKLKLVGGFVPLLVTIRAAVGLLTLLLTMLLAIPAKAAECHLKIYPGLDTATSEKPFLAMPWPPGRIGLVPYEELGGSLENGRIVFIGGAPCAAIHSVQVQYETSVSIMDEGPHLDLLEWQHFTSEWINVPGSSGSYSMPSFTQAQRTQFPAVERRELLAAIAKFGGEEWARLADRISSPTQYPAAVDISTLRIRVLIARLEGHRESVVLEFPIAMGC